MQTFTDKLVTTVDTDGKTSYAAVITQGQGESAESAFARAAALTKAHKIKATVEAAKAPAKPRAKKANAPVAEAA